MWAPHGHTEALDSLRRLAQIVLVDSQDEPDVTGALRRAADLSGYAYVVDLAWLRSTPWRERVAAAFDPPALRAALAGVSAVTVRHRQDSLAAALLFCGWLSSRLGWKAESLAASRRRADRPRARPPAGGPHQPDAGEQDSPGLAGVTIEIGVRRGDVARPRTRRPARGAPRARRRRADVDGAAAPRAAREASWAKESGRRCCATRPTGPR